ADARQRDAHDGLALAGRRGHVAEACSFAVDSQGAHRGDSKRTVPQIEAELDESERGGYRRRVLDRWLAAVRAPSRAWRFVGWSLLVVASAVCGLYGQSILWVVVPALVVHVGASGYETLRHRSAELRRARAEPVDEWVVELDGEDLGLLTGSTVI